jgi:hypothetical protein
MMSLITEEGPLDLCFVPAGFSDGYDRLSEHASVVAFGCSRSGATGWGYSLRNALVAPWHA